MPTYREVLPRIADGDISAISLVVQAALNWLPPRNGPQLSDMDIGDARAEVARTLTIALVSPAGAAFERHAVPLDWGKIDLDRDVRESQEPLRTWANDVLNRVSRRSLRREKTHLRLVDGPAEVEQSRFELSESKLGASELETSVQWSLPSNRLASLLMLLNCDRSGSEKSARFRALRELLLTWFTHTDAEPEATTKLIDRIRELWEEDRKRADIANLEARLQGALASSAVPRQGPRWRGTRVPSKLRGEAERACGELDRAVASNPNWLKEREDWRDWLDDAVNAIRVASVVSTAAWTNEPNRRFSAPSATDDEHLGFILNRGSEVLISRLSKIVRTPAAFVIAVEVAFGLYGERWSGGAMHSWWCKLQSERAKRDPEATRDPPKSAEQAQNWVSTQRMYHAATSVIAIAEGMGYRTDDTGLRATDT
jgi:hypothetical protein